MEIVKILIIWFVTILPTYPFFNKLRVRTRIIFGQKIHPTCLLYANVRFKGDVSVGKFCNFNENILIASTKPGKIKIGDYVIMGPNVVLRNANHIFEEFGKPIRYQGKDVRDIIIEDDVWIASNVVVLPGTIIRKGSVIGAGAVVRGEIPEFSIAVGVPAKVIKKRNENNGQQT